MNRFEKAARVVSLTFIASAGSLATHAAEQPIAKRVACTTVEPKYEELIGSSGVVVVPEPGGNKQYYAIVENAKKEVADIYQKKLSANATQNEKVIELSKLTENHSITVSFKDAAPNVTMEFKAVYDHTSTPQGEIDGYILPQFCKPLTHEQN